MADWTYYLENDYEGQVTIGSREMAEGMMAPFLQLDDGEDCMSRVYLTPEECLVIGAELIQIGLRMKDI